MPQEHIAVLPPKPTIAILCLILSCIILATFAYQDEAAWKDALTQFLENARGTPWALPIVCLCYLLCPLILFPIILLNLACAMVFGLWGIVYALIGGLLNAAVYFGIGHYVRRRRGGAGAAAQVGLRTRALPRWTKTCARLALRESSSSIPCPRRPMRSRILSQDYLR